MNKIVFIFLGLSKSSLHYIILGSPLPSFRNLAYQTQKYIFYWIITNNSKKLSQPTIIFIQINLIYWAERTSKGLLYMIYSPQKKDYQ